LGYIGNRPADSYTSFAVQHFTTSATTTYTLDNPVANENEIALFINNVRQEPGSSYAYTASGTTLTLSAATSASDTMYCVFIGKAVQTVTPATGSVTGDMMSYPLSNFSSTGIDDNADATAITIDSSENVGIGTTSPSDLLHLYKSSNDSIMRIQWDASHAGKISFREGGTETGQIEMHSPTDAVEAGNMLIATTSSGAAGKAIVFQTNSSERMRISAEGIRTGNLNETLGLTSSAYGLALSGNGYASLRIRRGSDSGACVGFYGFSSSTSVVGTISVTGSSTAYNTSSDHRLKENVIDLADATTRVKQLQPKRFNFIADADTTVDGFLAHEVSSIVPEAITGTHNEVDEEGNPVYQGIDQSKLVPLLTASLKEAIAKIEELETRIATLENA